MQIAIDYDNTYSADPTFWVAVIELAKKADHTVVMITCHYKPDEGFSSENDKVKIAAEDAKIRLIFTNGRPKEEFLQPDIWIDDQPVTIPIHAKLENQAEEVWHNFLI